MVECRYRPRPCGEKDSKSVADARVATSRCSHSQAAAGASDPEAAGRQGVHESVSVIFGPSKWAKASNSSVCERRQPEVGAVNVRVTITRRSVALGELSHRYRLLVTA